MNDNTRLFNGQNDKGTAIFSGDFIRKRLENPNRKKLSEEVSEDKKIAIFILGMVERVSFEDKTHVVLGRFERHHKTAMQLDLSDYGAAERGVSREHCQLSLQDGQLTVMDLGSSNGTFVGGTKLEPHNMYAVKKGEELLLGRLPIQIIF